MSFPTLARDLQNAFVLLEQGKSEDAALGFRGILGAAPTCIEARYGLFVASGGSSESERADLLRQFVNQDAFVFPGLLLHAGQWFLQSEQYESAARAFEAARKLLPGGALVALALGECRLARGDAAGAEAEARSIPAESADSVKARFLLGRALLWQRQIPEAIDMLRQCADVKKESAEVRDHLSYALLLGEQWNDALAATGFLASPPQQSTAVTLFVAARCLVQAGKLQAAENVYLTIQGSAGYIAARGRVLQGLAPRPADLNEAVLRAWWRSYGECLRAQGWFDKAMKDHAAALEVRDRVVCPDVWRSESPHNPGAPHLSLVTFSSGEVFGAFQKKLCRSALDAAQFNEAVLWTAQTLRETAFYRAHAAILDLVRGAGVWAWKPFIIYNELLRCADGDYVVYYDCGRKGNTISKPITEIIAWCDRSPHGILPGVEVASEPNRRWAKADCFHYMDAEAPLYWDRPHVQATFSVWKNSPFARSFVAQWMNFAVDPRLITDHPNVAGRDNHPEFLDHRHDQSILTNLVARHGLSLPRYGSKDINGLGAVLSTEFSR